MLDFKILIPDLNSITGRLKKLAEVQKKGMVRTINVWLLSVLRDSKEKPPRVPVDTGALETSGYTEPAKIDGATINAGIGYGGISGVDYAVIVHDNLSGRIKNYKRPGSGAKFLSTHVDARKPELASALEGDLGAGAKELFS